MHSHCFSIDHVDEIWCDGKVTMIFWKGFSRICLFLAVKNSVFSVEEKQSQFPCSFIFDFSGTLYLGYRNCLLCYKFDSAFLLRNVFLKILFLWFSQNVQKVPTILQVVLTKRNQSHFQFSQSSTVELYSLPCMWRRSVDASLVGSLCRREEGRHVVWVRSLVHSQRAGGHGPIRCSMLVKPAEKKRRKNTWREGLQTRTHSFLLSVLVLMYHCVSWSSKLR